LAAVNVLPEPVTPKECLMAVSRLDRLQQFRDCLPLIAARFEVGFKLKWQPLILAQHRQKRRG